MAWGNSWGEYDPQRGALEGELGGTPILRITGDATFMGGDTVSSTLSLADALGGGPPNANNDLMILIGLAILAVILLQ